MAATMLIYANSSIKGRRYEVKQTFIAGMHRAAIFSFGVGQKEFFWGGAGQGRATVKLRAFSGWGGVGWGGAVMKFFGAGAVQGSHFSWGRGGAGRRGSCIPDLFFFIKAALHK